MLGALRGDLQLALTSTKLSVAEAASRALLVAAGAAIGAVGLGFLTVSAWIWLEREHSALTAATVIGSVYLLVGVIVILIAKRRRTVAAALLPPAPLSAPALPARAPIPPRMGGGPVVVPLLEAFVMGLGAAMTLTRRRRR